MPTLSLPAQSSLAAEAFEEARRRIQARALHQAMPYTPRGGALEVCTARDREVLVCGPAGTGKTRGILEYIDDLGWDYPGIRVLFVRKTRVSLVESVLYTFEEFVLPQGSPILDGAQRLNRQKYVYPNGTEIGIGGLDKPSKLFSTEWDLIYVNEAIELSLADWESLFRSLRHYVLPWQQIIADTNPDVPTHWLKQRCDEGTTRLIPSSHEDNPLLWDAERGEWTPEGLAYLANLDAMTGARKARMRHGLWSQAEGAVYDDFDASVHVVDADKVPPFVRRFRVVDFGFTNPFVCQWWGVDYDGRLYLYREIYFTHRTVKVHSAQIRELSAGEAVETTVADHDAEDRATLDENGIPTLPARKEISVGIQKVQLRLKRAADGLPRLFVVRGARVERDQALADKKLPTSTEEEFPGYIWPVGRDGKPVKEVPLDLNNHGMDGARYIVMHVDGPNVPAPSKLVAVAKRHNQQPPSAGYTGMSGLIAPGKRSRR